MPRRQASGDLKTTCRKSLAIPAFDYVYGDSGSRDAFSYLNWAPVLKNSVKSDRPSIPQDLYQFGSAMAASQDAISLNN